MGLLGDSNQEVINYLSCEDIINLKKSGEIDNFPDNKLRELLSKKLSISPDFFKLMISSQLK